MSEEIREFKCRCHAINKIMTNPKKGEKGLSKTCITYLEEWVKGEYYKKRKEIKSKYLKKGILCEAEAIQFAADYFKWGMVEKNTISRSNEYLEGEPDVILFDSIPDIKNSFDCFTFPLFDKEPKKENWWQIQGYVDIWGFAKGSVVYTLMDAPEEIVWREARNKSFEMGFQEVDNDLYEQVKEEMTYSHLPDYLRIKRFEFARDDKAIQEIYQRVRECREYIKTNLIIKP